MFGGILPGSDPAEAAGHKLRFDIAARRASRAYDAHCRSCGMNPLEARLLAPKLVQRGQALRQIELRTRQREAFRQKKQQLDRQFGSRGGAS
jgi:hypothetical protein